MIKIYPATVNTASPSVWAIEIDESVRNGIGENTTPTVSVTVDASGSPITAGGTTVQNFVMIATLTYQPCSKCSETKVKMYSETVAVAVPGAMTTFEPNVGAASVTLTKTGCCGKAYGVKIWTSLTVGYSA